MKFIKHTTYTVEMDEQEFLEYQNFLKFKQQKLDEPYTMLKNQRDNILAKYNEEVEKRKKIEDFINKYQNVK